MDLAIKQTIQGYTAVFDSFTISDPNLKAEIETFINDFNAVGENSSDIMDFMAKFPASGLQEKYSGLIAKASMPPAVATQESTSQQEKPANSLPTVSEFLEQYRESYNAVKGAGYRTRAEKAYENIFAVADRTTSLIEMNIILEEEQLLWKIVTEDLLDIYQTILDATDPLNLANVSRFEKMIKTISESTCQEELSYKTEVDVSINQQRTYSLITTIIIPSLLALTIMEYNKCKLLFRTWQKPQEKLLMVISQRATVKKTYEFIKEKYGWDFDYLVNDEWMKVWLLGPVTVDVNARIRKSLDPQNIEAMRELLFDEILSDRTIDDILLTEQKNVVFFDLDQTARQALAIHEKVAQELNKDIVYFQYYEKLQGAAAANDIKLPETDNKKFSIS